MRRSCLLDCRRCCRCAPFPRCLPLPSLLSLASPPLLAHIQPTTHSATNNKQTRTHSKQQHHKRRTASSSAHEARRGSSSPQHGGAEATVSSHSTHERGEAQARERGGVSDNWLTSVHALLPCGCSESLAPADGSPAHWDPIDPAHGNTSLVLLNKNNLKHAAEIAAVEQGWTMTGGFGTIVSIHRVQNLHLHKQYEAKKAELQKAGHPIHSDVRVYHGTRNNSPSLIHSGTCGFDPSLGAARPG